MSKNPKQRVEKRFHVYVIEIDSSRFVFAGEGVVYVGETELSPKQRLKKHLERGRGSARVIRRHRVLGLRPDLAPGGSPFATREEALEWESATAERLRAQGFRVYGGQGKPFMDDDW